MAQRLARELMQSKDPEVINRTYWMARETALGAKRRLEGYSAGWSS
jgi:hypothetical protein